MNCPQCGQPLDKDNCCKKCGICVRTETKLDNLIFPQVIDEHNRKGKPPVEGTREKFNL